MKKELVFFMSALSVMCSCSESSEELYDEVLSNTVWAQDYVTPPYIKDEGSDLREYWKLYLSVLKSEALSAAIKYDTLWRYYDKGSYSLNFMNERCEMKETYQRNGEYRIKTLKVSPVFYPDQEFRDTSMNGGFSVALEIKVKKDSVFVKESSEANDRIFSFKLDEENVFYMDIEETGISDYYDYEDEPKIETCNMTFTRNGNNIMFSGDKEYTGVLNEAMDEMEISGIGTLYRQ